MSDLMGVMAHLSSYIHIVRISLSNGDGGGTEQRVQVHSYIEYNKVKESPEAILRALDKKRMETKSELIKFGS